MKQNITDLLGLGEEAINVLLAIENNLQNIEENLSLSNEHFETIAQKLENIDANTSNIV